MTVSSETNRISYVGTVGTGPYPYTWKILASDELLVYDGATLLTETTHYTVSGVGTASGGNVTLTYTPTATNTILIVDAPEYTQETDYTENDPFPAASHENALDKLTRLALRLKETLARSLKLTITSTLSDISLPVPSGGQVIGWNSTGTGLTNFDMADVSSAPITGVGQSLIQNTTITGMVQYLAASDMAASVVRGTTGDDIQSAIGITAFMRSVLDDEASSTARNTLGINIDHFDVYCAASTTIEASVYVKMAFDTNASTVSDVFSTPLNRFTAPARRNYLLSAMLFFRKIASGAISGSMNIYKNGSVFRSVPFESTHPTGATLTCAPTWSEAVNLNAGDYIEVYAYCVTTVSVVGATANSYFSGVAL